MHYRPNVMISANDNDITAQIMDALIDIVITDHSGSQSDQIAIKLHGHKIGQLPPPDALLRVSLGFNGVYIQQGTWTVDRIDVAGWPEVVTISGNAAPMKASGNASVQTQRTQAWHNVSFEDVIKTCATRAGLSAIVSAQLASIMFEHIDQSSESDMALITRLARQHSAVSKISQQNWLLVAEGEGKNASGTQSLPVRTVNANMCNDYGYTQQTRNQLSSAVAKYHDEETGKTGSVRHGKGEPAFEILYVYKTKAEAEAAVKSRAKSISSTSKTFNCVTAANLELLNVFAEGHLKAIGWRPEISEVTWRIKTVTKTVTPSSGITIKFDCDNGAKSSK
ncbi:contractile injection system protein, VgrG/Pvc8 family [Photobacterium leiognathi]|uniref:contractile injection system protein, VgrG/Pvc8 family n=1 Tax=Photobacterium leiognathi TaxID=553611 RepID=UPI002739799E|nr:contractile injection system protein, VgrG/Pvc8 family [Photobacterium leiognathi]